MPSPRPPDLDAQGRPVGQRPPDLDASGKPVGGPWGSWTPQDYKVTPDLLADRKAMRQTIAGTAPAVGGFVGGMMGGVPGAVGGGMVGSRVGQYITALDEGLPPAGEAIRENVKSGAVQGALEGVGKGIAFGAGKSATWLMNRALNPSDRLAREFPNLSQDLIDNAITVSKGGYEKARRMLSAAKGGVNAGLQVAEQAGATIPAMLTPEIAESLKAVVVEQAIKSGGAKTVAGAPVAAASARLPPAAQAMMQAIDDAVKNGTAFDLSPTLADALKSKLQLEAKSVFTSALAANGRTAVPASRAIKADYAAELNTAIDAIAKGYKSGNKEAQKMIGVTRGVRAAIRPGKNLYQAMVRPGVGALLGGAAGYQQHGSSGAILGTVGGAVASSPGTMSREAILLAHPAVQSFLGQLPRATVAAIERDVLQRQSPVPEQP